jgi:type IV pilus assembly protein PilB
MPLKRYTTKQLGELLIERGIITKDKLDYALNVQKKHGGQIGEILVELGYAKEEDIAQALTTQYGFPYLPLDNYELDPVVVKIIPENVARQYRLIPIEKIGNSLTVAMSNPLNQEAIEDIELLTNCTVQVFVSTNKSILKAIEKYYKPLKDASS